MPYVLGDLWVDGKKGDPGQPSLEDQRLKDWRQSYGDVIASSVPQAPTTRQVEASANLADLLQLFDEVDILNAAICASHYQDNETVLSRLRQRNRYAETRLETILDNVRGQKSHGLEVRRY